MRTIQIDFSFKLDLNSCCMLLVEIFRIHCRMSSFAKTSALACHCPLLKNIAHICIYMWIQRAPSIALKYCICGNWLNNNLVLLWHGNKCNKHLHFLMLQQDLLHGGNWAVLVGCGLRTPKPDKDHHNEHRLIITVYWAERWSTISCTMMHFNIFLCQQLILNLCFADLNTWWGYLHTNPRLQLRFKSCSTICR